MRILGLDTATPATAVALWDEQAGLELEARDDPPPDARPAHATRLLPLLGELLERGETGWQEVDRIAVGLGPGSFTGLRIGVATARALGQARGIPLVGVSTLQSLALGARAHGTAISAGSLMAVIDARRGEAFAAAWPSADVCSAPNEAASVLGTEALGRLASRLAQSVLAVGDGAIKFYEVLERSGASIPEQHSELHRVHAINHCRLAAVQGVSAIDDIRPTYLRVPDAELTRRSAHRQ